MSSAYSKYLMAEREKRGYDCPGIVPRIVKGKNHKTDPFKLPEIDSDDSIDTSEDPTLGGVRINASPEEIQIAQYIESCTKAIEKIPKPEFSSCDIKIRFYRIEKQPNTLLREI